MIEVNSLTKRYGNSRGINDVSFHVKEGEIVGFLGPNGAGKTTTMNILTGYLSATSGAASVAGIDVQKDPIAAKKRIGYLPEHPPLYVEMTVREYLKFICRLKGVPSSQHDTSIVEACELVSITDVQKRVIRNLSKGYRQRVGLAQALIGNPDVLILDEPTVGLDPRQITEIRKTISTLGKKRTIILSTHILPEVSAICERVLIIANGKIVADGDPNTLSQDIAEKSRLVVRLPGNPSTVMSALKSVDGVRGVEQLAQLEKGAYDYAVSSAPNIDVRKPLFNTLAKANVPILRLAPETLSLEEVFLRLVEQDDPQEEAIQA
ncbi:MAG: ABC transporter ATP-binding protein [Oscillospiraceae bacterium]|nr:ABC transporter ATP-binding protein [Oscillospiraceae bacterium]